MDAEWNKTAECSVERGEIQVEGTVEEKWCEKGEICGEDEQEGKWGKKMKREERSKTDNKGDRKEHTERGRGE